MKEETASNLIFDVCPDHTSCHINAKFGMLGDTPKVVTLAGLQQSQLMGYVKLESLSSVFCGHLELISIIYANIQNPLCNSVPLAPCTYIIHTKFQQNDT